MPINSSLGLGLRGASNLLAVAWLVLGGLSAAAQTAAPTIPGYVHSTWTTEHGLPQNLVLALVQTRDGYLWVGTGNGLARFDGLAFRVFDMGTTPELPSGWISDLYEDADGALWIGTDLGLVEYTAGVFRRHAFDGSPHVRSIQSDPQGRLWVATLDRLVRRDSTGWTGFPIETGAISGHIVDRDGTVWIGTDDGLVEWNGRVVRTFTARDGLPAGRIWPLLDDRAGGLWVRGFPGLSRLDRRTGTIAPAPGRLRSAYVRRVIESRDGTLWAAGHDGLFSIDGGGRVAAHDFLSGHDTEIAAMLIDADERLWMGATGGPGGLHRLNPRRATVLDKSQGLPCDNTVPVLQAPDGTIWTGVLCRDGGGLVSIRDGRVTRYHAAAGGSPSSVASLEAPPGGGLWIGSFGSGLTHLKDGRTTRYTAENSGLVGRDVVALARDRDDALWIGSEAGLHRLHQGRWTRFTTADGLVHDEVRALQFDADGALWVGTSNGLSRYAGGRFHNLTRADGLPPGAVRAVHVDAERTVWIGTHGGGLARLKDGRVTAFGTQDGLLDSSVHRILEADQGDLWLSGDRGIRRVRRADLNDLAEGRTTRLTVDLFDKRDGMKNEEANGFGQPAGWRMNDGSLWFPTQGGLVRIDPGAVNRQSNAPAVTIEDVRIGGRAHDPRQAIAVPPGATDLEIRYTASAFLRPELTQFRYRLAGHDGGWIDAGTRRVAHYANLAPGSYRFEVAARSAAGLWSERPTAVEMTFEPRLHQRRWVQLTALLAAAGTIYMAERLRLARLRRRATQLEATVTERTTELRHEQERLELANRQLGAANEQAGRANRALEASHTHLLTVFDQLRTGVLVVDTEERILFASEATMRLLAAGAGGLVGRALSDVLPMSPTALEDVRAELLTPHPERRITTRLEPQPGQQFWTDLEVRVDPRNAGHRILYLYDVTETYDLGRTTAGDGAEPGARLTGTSAALRRVRSGVATLAGVDTTVLIEGETGTGKELVARAIHEASARRARPFVAINCAGLTESILASQLFGHRRGAFTGAVSDHVGLFEAAQGGTLLLDEVGDMPLAMQTHLLRVLQEREIIRVGDTKPRPIDVRVLASTHRTLEAEVAAGRFREDLFYRIRVARLALPPLRQRPEDVPLLVATFVERFAAEHGKAIRQVSREAMERLQRHRWPGNVRELGAAVERAVIHTAGPVIKPSDLPPELATDDVPPPRGPMAAEERQILIEALRRVGGNRSEAARLLGISRTTLYRRLAALEQDALDREQTV